LVSLAKRLEGKPFHLIATHCQQRPKAGVVDYIKSQGLAPDTPNMTVSSFGGHPKVKGNGYVPYYMVFDHTGKLHHHHMCGAYHGGDGLRMIELVDELLEDAPAIYLGEEPYTHIAALAKQIERKKAFASTIKKIERARAAEDTPDAERAEYDRLHAAIESYRDRMIARATKLAASQPSAVTDVLKDLVKELKGTAVGKPAEAHLATVSRAPEHKTALALEKKLGKILKDLEKRKAKDSLSAKARAKAVEKMEALLEDGGAALPFGEAIRKAIAAWRA